MPKLLSKPDGLYAQFDSGVLVKMASKPEDGGFDGLKLLGEHDKQLLQSCIMLAFNEGLKGRRRARSGLPQNLLDFLFETHQSKDIPS